MTIPKKVTSKYYAKKFCFRNLFDVQEGGQMQINFGIRTAENNFLGFCHIDSHLVSGGPGPKWLQILLQFAHPCIQELEDSYRQHT
jgi:hypothetical protein